jgi:hypothetical protein
MRAFFYTVALPLILLCAGCAAAGAAPKAGDQLVLRGTLVLKGNAPMPVATLVIEDYDQWTLQEVDRELATQLQNRKVVVHGTVVRPQAQGPLQKSLRATHVAPID